MKAKNFIIIGSSVIVTGTAIAIILTKKNRKKEMDTLVSILTGTTTQYGDSRDLATSKAFDTSFYTNNKSKAFSTGWMDYMDDTITKFADDIHSDLNASLPVSIRISQNCTAAISVIKTNIHSKFQLAHLASTYQTKYNTPLLTDLQAMDSSFLGLGGSTTYMDQVYAIVNALPDNAY